MSKTQVIAAAIERQKRIRAALTEAAHLVGMAVLDSNANQIVPLSRLADTIYAHRDSVDTLIARVAESLTLGEL